MKASESVANFLPTARMYTNFTLRTIKKICSEIGPRECGTPQELEAQNFMAKQVGDAADEVKQDEFKVAPRAFLGWLRIAGILMLITIAVGVINIFAAPQVMYSAYFNIFATIIVCIMLFGEFLFYKEVTDPFFPKAISHNTYCVRKPTGEVKRRIILCGHSDSSIEWRPTYVGGRYLLYVSFAVPIIGLIFMLITYIMMLSKGELNTVILWIDCAFIPSYIWLSIFMNYKICVDGANDNLTGCMMGASVVKFMGDNNIRFENTEVVAMFSGGEEAGLRGAKAAAKQHPEFKDPNIETCVIGFDTIKDYDDMAIYYRDMTCTVKHDPRAVELLRAAGKNCGLDIPLAVLFFGSSDAAATTQAGIPSALFAAMNPGPPRYYHTRGDKADIMEAKTIEKGVQLALETVFLFDEQGLQNEYK